jgi:hypothetical protein
MIILGALTSPPGDLDQSLFSWNVVCKSQKFAHFRDWSVDNPTFQVDLCGRRGVFPTPLYTLVALLLENFPILTSRGGQGKEILPGLKGQTRDIVAGKLSMSHSHRLPVPASIRVGTLPHQMKGEHTSRLPTWCYRALLGCEKERPG